MEMFLNKGKIENQSKNKYSSNNERNSIFNITDRNSQNNDSCNTNNHNIRSSSDQVFARIDNNKGLLILHPDMLISPTKIAEAIGCARRGVISERVKTLGSFSKPAVLGNLRHSFIESTIEICLARLSGFPIPFNPSSSNPAGRSSSGSGSVTGVNHSSVRSNGLVGNPSDGNKSYNYNSNKYNVNSNFNNNNNAITNISIQKGNFNSRPSSHSRPPLITESEIQDLIKTR